jgi:uncharacterized membrane protein HdeD (DUF308 family)
MIGMMAQRSVREHWWSFLVRGIIAIVFAIACIWLTGATILALTLWVGVFFIADGIFMIMGAYRSLRTSRHGHWWWQLLGGIVGIIAGALTLWWPGITAITLALFIGWWALMTGVLELITAVRFRSTLQNEWLWVLNGILSIILGALMALFPAAGLYAIVWMIGVYAFIAGVSMIVLAFRLRPA